MRSLWKCSQLIEMFVSLKASIYETTREVINVSTLLCWNDVGRWISSPRQSNCCPNPSLLHVWQPTYFSSFILQYDENYKRIQSKQHKNLIIMTWIMHSRERNVVKTNWCSESPSFLNFWSLHKLLIVYGRRASIYYSSSLLEFW